MGYDLEPGDAVMLEYESDSLGAIGGVECVVIEDGTQFGPERTADTDSVVLEAESAEIRLYNDGRVVVEGPQISDTGTASSLKLV